jgi:hypothetical protein
MSAFGIFTSIGSSTKKERKKQPAHYDPNRPNRWAKKYLTPHSLTFTPLISLSPVDPLPPPIAP